MHKKLAQSSSLKDTHVRQRNY